LVEAKANDGKHWAYQAARINLNLARVAEMLGEDEEASTLAEEALRLADASGYRHYAMRARQIASRTSAEPNVASRHARVATALARSLAANLTRDDADHFMSRQEITGHLKVPTGD